MPDSVNEIREIFHKYDLQVSWVARQIGVSESRLYYLLEKGKDVSKDFYDQLKIFLDKHNFK